MKKLTYTNGRRGVENGSPRNLDVDFLGFAGHRIVRVTLTDGSTGDAISIVLDENQFAELGTALLDDIDFLRARRNRK